MSWMDRTIVIYCCLIGGIGQASTLDEAWRRVFFVESSNGANPAAFIENHARALGIAQITPIVVRDVNRILCAPVFVLSDRLDPLASREMFRVYCEHYYPHGTIEQFCRLWHRGPNRKHQYDKHGSKYWAMCRKVG